MERDRGFESCFLQQGVYREPIRAGGIRPGNQPLAGADSLDRSAGMLFLEHRREVILDVIDHVLVVGGDEIERRLLLRRIRREP